VRPEPLSFRFATPTFTRWIMRRPLVASSGPGCPRRTARFSAKRGPRCGRRPGPSKSRRNSGGSRRRWSSPTSSSSAPSRRPKRRHSRRGARAHRLVPARARGSTVWPRLPPGPWAARAPARRAGAGRRQLPPRPQRRTTYGLVAGQIHAESAHRAHDVVGEQPALVLLLREDLVAARADARRFLVAARLVGARTSVQSGLDHMEGPA